MESRDHLFFGSNYSYSVWNQDTLSRKARTPAIRQWSRSITCMQGLSTPKHHRLLSLLTWQAVIYALWLERNSRIHRKEY
uniref:Reverse transcriptase zinc-binding domain-containing protein n=1 Tax=Brassica oleracea var. oleracea TaxID=109376 RepID=A0A0D3BHI7_BRAOL